MTTTGKDIYEYAILRLVPKVEREEFINVGVILYCKNQRFIGCEIHIDSRKILALDPNADINSIETHLNAFQLVCKGNKNRRGIASLEIAERFRWLNAKRSTLIQTSPTHVGITSDPFKALQDIFEKMVL